MKIESNILGVRDRCSRLQRAVPVAIERALAPDQWLEDARAMAERVLLGVAQPKERQFIPVFVRTVLAGVLPGGFTLTMRNPFPPAQTLADLQAARAAMSPADLFSNLFRGQVQQFEDLLAEWVATVKDKDQRDAGKTDAEIAEFISYALLAPGGDSLIVRSGPNQGRTVREVFTPHIVDYLTQRQALQRLDAATASHWLRLVLAAWRELVRLKFPEKFRAHLRVARGEL